MSRFKLFLIWIVCLLGGLVAVQWMFFSIISNSPRALKLAIAFDQVANAAFGGDEDETISSRCWRNRNDGFHHHFVRLIDWLFQDPNHCEKSFKNEQIKKMRFFSYE